MQASKKTHKLLIEVALVRDVPHPLHKYLKPSEVLPNETFSVSLRFTNLGTETFQGGRITSLYFTFGDKLRKDMMQLIDPHIPTLEPNKPTDVLRCSNPASYEGIAWIRLAMIANDNNPIEYYQAREYKLDVNEWVQFFRVLSPTDVILLQILEELKRKV